MACKYITLSICSICCLNYKSLADVYTNTCSKLLPTLIPCIVRLVILLHLTLLATLLYTIHCIVVLFTP